MESPAQSTQLIALAELLSDLRDSLMLVSMALKDHISNTPSPERDEVILEVKLQLARISELAPRNS
jgi:hypothetical protein